MPFAFDKKSRRAFDAQKQMSVTLSGAMNDDSNSSLFRYNDEKYSFRFDFFGKAFLKHVIAVGDDGPRRIPIQTGVSLSRDDILAFARIKPNFREYLTKTKMSEEEFVVLVGNGTLEYVTRGSECAHYGVAPELIWNSDGFTVRGLDKI